MSDATKRLQGSLKEYGILGALIVIVLLFDIMTQGRLLDPNNVASLIQQNAYVMILAVGMTMVIVGRHIDLSVGSVVGFVGGIVAILMYNMHWNWGLACLVAIGIGVLIGCWQGFWVAIVGIPAFIVTLGGMLLFRGLTIVLVGVTVSSLPQGFVKIANGSIPNFLGFAGNMDVVTLVLGLIAIAAIVVTAVRARVASAKDGAVAEPMVAFVIRNGLVALVVAFITYLLSLSAGGTPLVLIIVGVLIVAYSFVMSRTRFGRHIYAVGGNIRAARLSGINTKKVDFMIFVNMGILAAIAGIVTTSRAGAAVATAGNLYEMDAIAAAYIGGCAVTGGVGKIRGAIIGALIMGVLNMGLSILSVDSAWQQSIKGLVVIVAVAADLLTSRKNGN